jgi:hypothetical protein
MERFLNLFRKKPAPVPASQPTAKVEPEKFIPMKVCYFQLQIASEYYSNPRDAETFLRDIDPACPLPQPLEGGNARGPLFQCILDDSKREALKQALENHVVPLYNEQGFLLDPESAEAIRIRYKLLQEGKPLKKYIIPGALYFDHPNAGFSFGIVNACDYRPDMFILWNFGKPPSLSATPD